MHLPEEKWIDEDRIFASSYFSLLGGEGTCFGMKSCFAAGKQKVGRSCFFQNGSDWVSSPDILHDMPQDYIDGYPNPIPVIGNGPWFRCPQLLLDRLDVQR